MENVREEKSSQRARTEYKLTLAYRLLRTNPSNVDRVT